MMTVDEIELLMTEELRRAIADNIENDPIKIALNKKLPYAALIATQVKYLQRAKRKLPSYYHNQCVIPSLSFEQSSSEECAATKSYSGGVALDLTCGLGVDSYYLSKRFSRVITLEREPVLAHLAKRNFELLGADNIEVVAMSAQEFVAHNRELKVDVIYVDPDRRGAMGEKLFKLEDCSPNILELMSDLRAMAGVLVVKCSPLMDCDEALRLCGQESSVEVLSLGGECKEVVITIDANQPQQQVTATAIGVGSLTMPYDRARMVVVSDRKVEEYNYMVVPDVALQKSRLARDYYAQNGACMESDTGYAYAVEKIQEPWGKQYKIATVMIYNPKKIRQELKKLGIKKITILKHDFCLETSKIVKDLAISEGGVQKIAFTKFRGEFLAIFLE